MEKDVEYYVINPTFPPITLSPEYLFFVPLILKFLYNQATSLNVENDSIYIVFYEEIVF